MKKRSLATASGITGLIGGIILLFGFAIVAGTAMTENSVAIVTVFVILALLKIAILTLGITGTVYYRDDSRVGTMPGILLIVGGGVSLLLGFVGGIVAIVGASFYLSKLKNFKA
ncbi:hypothetical protein ACRYI5_09615 [Furfurilactobacillus sp. WILCCON 0119]